MSGVIQSLLFGFSVVETTGSIALSDGTTPFVYAYPWALGFGTKYSNPSTLPASTGYGVRFSPSGTQIAVGHATSPYISTYPWSPGFGTKYANPGTIIFATTYSIAFNPSGNVIAIASDLGGGP